MAPEVGAFTRASL